MASVNWQKCKAANASATRAVIRHNLRTHSDYANPDIDRSLAWMNSAYVDGERMEEGYQLNPDYVAYRWEKRTGEVESNMRDIGARIRKDRVNAIEVCFTAPEGIEEGHEFFDRAYDALGEFFGKENVIYGAVHRDEVHSYYDPAKGEMVVSRPHMHALIVPETDGRLCAKDVMARSRLIDLNRKMDEICRGLYGRDYQTGEGKHGISVERLKMQSVRAEADKARQDASKAEELEHLYLQKYQKHLVGLKEVSQKVSSLNKYLDGVKPCMDAQTVTKGSFGKKQEYALVPIEQYKDERLLLESADALPKVRDEFLESVSGERLKSAQQKISELEKENSSLKEQVSSLHSENVNLQFDVSRLRGENRKARDNLKKILESIGVRQYCRILDLPYRDRSRDDGFER